VAATKSEPAPENMLPIVCSTCQTIKQVKPTAKDLARLPRGWKRIGEAVHCDACWRNAYTVRAVTLSVASPVSCDWPALRDILRNVLGAATALANWAVDTLVAHDVRRKPGDTKLEKQPQVYLYGLAKDQFAQWGMLDSQAAAGLLTEVSRVYSSERWDCLWLGSRSVRRYRYPYPYPLSAQSIALEEEEDGGIIIAMRLGGARQRLRLKGGRRYYRQTAALRHLIANPDLICGSAITIERHAGERDSSTPTATPGGGNTTHSEVRVKIVGWFPAEQAGPAGTLRVNTTADALLVAVTPEGDRIWTYNADHAKRMVAAHARHMQQLHRLADDTKAERRKPRYEGLPYREMVAARSRKDNDRMTTLCHEVSAGLAAFAARQRVSQVLYNDTVRSFVYSFPWAKLRTMLQQKLRAKGIELIVSAPAAADKAASTDNAETPKVQ